ncbi:hypothetical protein D3C86_1551940 [compost metagenome]
MTVSIPRANQGVDRPIVENAEDEAGHEGHPLPPSFIRRKRHTGTTTALGRHMHQAIGSANTAQAGDLVAIAGDRAPFLALQCVAGVPWADADTELLAPGGNHSEQKPHAGGDAPAAQPSLDQNPDALIRIGPAVVTSSSSGIEIPTRHGVIDNGAINPGGQQNSPDLGGSLGIRLDVVHRSDDAGASLHDQPAWRRMRSWTCTTSPLSFTNSTRSMITGPLGFGLGLARSSRTGAFG